MDDRSLDELRMRGMADAGHDVGGDVAAERDEARGCLNAVPCGHDRILLAVDEVYHRIGRRCRRRCIARGNRHHAAEESSMSLRGFQRELALAMALCGARTVDEVTRDLVA